MPIDWEEVNGIPEYRVRKIDGPGTLTVRDHYVMAALTGLLANPNGVRSEDDAVAAAIRIADYVLERRT